ncbi:hypothetical protein TRVL_05255 [Trypanosoma vivax]|nr:hypothetical protein TRVL_05255 [Trypanosoma vivax]
MNFSASAHKNIGAMQGQVRRARKGVGRPPGTSLDCYCERTGDTGGNPQGHNAKRTPLQYACKAPLRACFTFSQRTTKTGTLAARGNALCRQEATPQTASLFSKTN